MAEYAIRPIAPVRGQETDTYFHRPLKAGETFLTGAVVVIDSNNETAEAGADPASIAGIVVAGAADYAWKEDTFATVVPSVPIAKADQMFRGTLEGTFAAADVGSAFGLVLDASGYWTIDRSETSATRVTILDVDDGVEVGDVNVPVRFKFLSANIQEVA